MTTTSSGTTLLESGRRLASLVRHHADYGDTHGQLAPEVAEAFHDRRLWGMWVPGVLGGAELDPLSSLELVEEISYADAAAGWVLFAVALATAHPAVYLSDAGVEVFEGDRMPTMAGQGAPGGTADRVDGGYRLNGSWSFASGVRHVSHVFTLGVVEGTDEARVFVLPVDQVTLVKGSWDVLGLRGTASLDYKIDDVFIPNELTYAASLDERPLRGGVLGKLGIAQMAAIGHSGWALGVGRRLLDEFSAGLREKAGRAGGQAVSDSMHEQYATAEATLRSARAFVHETWADAWETLAARGEDLSKRQGSLIRLALNNATWSAHKVGLFVYVAGGTRALRAGAIQRYYRDLHAGTQHILSGPAIHRDVGRELAGLADGERWFFTNLVDSA